MAPSTTAPITNSRFACRHQSSDAATAEKKGNAFFERAGLLSAFPSMLVMLFLLSG
jgi:hypothetical protein